MSDYSKARIISLQRPFDARVKEIPMPELTDDSIVVETVMTGISLGTEMKLYRGISIDKCKEVWFPMVPGYESVGEVVFVGPKAKVQEQGYMPKVGDRVMANEIRFFPDHCAAWGGQTGLAIKNSKTAGLIDGLAKIPDGISYEQAVCAYLPSVALKGMRRLAPKDGETILVTGCGQVGLAAMQLAKIFAKCTVIALDEVSGRAKRAAQFADHVIDASTCDPVKKLRELTDGRGVDAIDECSGNPAIVDTLKFYLRGGGWERGESAGRIHLQGDYPKPIMLSSYNDWFCTNGTITMSCALQPGDKTDILKFMAEGKFKCGWNEPKSVEDAPALYKEIDRNYFEFLKPILKWK